MINQRQRSIPLLVVGLAGLLVSVLAGAAENIPFLKSLCTEACKDTAEISLLSAPVWTWGAVFWAAVVLTAYFNSNLTPWIAAPAFGMEAALVWIMVRMGASCMFCIANAAIVVILLVLSFRRKLFWQQLALALLFVLIGTAWIPYENKLFASTAARDEGVAENDVAARIGDEIITNQRLEVMAGTRLLDLQKEIYRIRRDKLDQLIIEFVLQKEAKERGQTPEQFVEENFPASKFSPTEQEIEKSVQDNQDRLKEYQGPPEELRPRVKAFLEQQKRNQAIIAFANALGPKYGLRIFLQMPQQAKLKVDIDNAASLGSPDAPVTVVEFSDYECPACRATHDTVKKIKEIYGNRLRWVFMDYPLRRHKFAFKAAEAAHCAGDQGKFWEYQEIAYTREKLDRDSLIQYASELGLSTDAFRSCLDKDKYKDMIEKSIKSASNAGVDRTPSFLINGTLSIGGPAFENFKARIDEELKKRD